MYLSGYCTPKLKLACFVCYLKIMTTFLKNNVSIVKQIVQGTQKWHWNLSRPSSFLSYGSKQYVLFWSVTQNHLAYLNSNDIFEFFGQFAINACIIFLQGVDNFAIEHKHANFWLGVQYPLKWLVSRIWPASSYIVVDKPRFVAYTCTSKYFYVYHTRCVCIIVHVNSQWSTQLYHNTH